MSFLGGPRFDGRSDPSTQRSLSKLQHDPVRLASLLAGANGVVPARRRRRVGFFTMSALTIVLLLSAVEAPDLLAEAGWIGPRTGTHSNGTGTQAGAPNHTGRRPASQSTQTPSAPGKATPSTPPATLAHTVGPTGPAARRTATQTASPTATATPTTHGKSKQHGKPKTGGR